jgi:hypothetical protein
LKVVTQSRRKSNLLHCSSWFKHLSSSSIKLLLQHATTEFLCPFLRVQMMCTSTRNNFFHFFVYFVKLRIDILYNSST